MTVSVLVSSNERPLVRQAFSKLIPSVKFERIDDGDIQVFSENQLAFLVERKTLEDLRGSYASKDHHLQDQVARMLRVCDEKCAYGVLLVESKEIPSWSSSPPTSWFSRCKASKSFVSDKALNACLAKLQLYERLRVLFTRTPEETARCVKWLVEHIEKKAYQPPAPSSVEPKPTTLGPAVPVASTARLKNASKEDIHAAMLACIPTISQRKAKRLLYACGGGLAGVRKVVSEKKKPKVEGIGKKAWQTLYDYLHTQ